MMAGGEQRQILPLKPAAERPVAGAPCFLLQARRLCVDIYGQDRVTDAKRGA
jgi:hypothetical protein